jgi:hypothetical protein
MQNNYIKILDWITEHKADLVVDGTLEVQHDVWCAFFSQQPCNCQPNVLSAKKIISYPREILHEN